MSGLQRFFRAAGWRAAAWGKRYLLPSALRCRRARRRAGGHGHTILLAVTHEDGGRLTNALDSILSNYPQGLEVLVITHRRERRWVNALLHHFSGDMPVRMISVAGRATHAALLRAGLDHLPRQSRHVAFMRGCDNWSRYGLWRLVSLNLHADADVLAGGVEHVCGTRRNLSFLSSQVRDRSYELSASQMPALLFDGQIFGKFFRVEMAREILDEAGDEGIDGGGFAHGGLQSILRQASVSIFGVPVYQYASRRPVNASKLLPLDDPTFDLHHILRAWRDNEELLNGHVWPMLLSPAFYFPVPDNKNGKQWMVQFLERNLREAPIPEHLLRARNGDKPVDLFVQALANGHYEQAYDLMKRCRYRATRKAEMPVTLQKLHAASPHDDEALANLCQRVRQYALSRTSANWQPETLRRGKAFQRYVLDRMEGFGIHRSGWAGVMHALVCKAAGEAEVFVESFLERTYCWDADLEVPRREVPWVGFAHRPPNIPQWYPEDLRRQFYHHPDFLRSLDTCLGIFALSEYHARHLRRILPVPVDVLYHPADKVERTWDRDLLHKRPKVVQVGFWLRRMHGIHFLPEGNYQKMMLNKGSKESAAARAFQREAELLRQEGHDLDALYETVRELDFLPDDEYDRLLSGCVVFLDMYDASANNTVVECMVRHTPLLVRRLPPVEEYLGSDYPLFFDDYDEAAAKLEDRRLIISAHEHLKREEVQRRVDMQLFTNNFLRSPLFAGLASGGRKVKALQAGGHA